MTSLYCIRDAGGIRRFKTYLSREQAQAAIDREEDRDPGCRAPFSVVEFVEATSVVRAADQLFSACERVYCAVTPTAVGSAIQTMHEALQAARGVRS